jgi:hypothetical protein
VADIFSAQLHDMAKHLAVNEIDIFDIEKRR